MGKFGLVTILFLMLAGNIWAQSDVSKSRWRSKEMKIDGNSRDWALPLNFYDDKTGLMFAICNDRADLYFAFTCNDEMKMRKIMSAGWTMELTSKEKHLKFRTALIFPGTKTDRTGERRAAGNVPLKIKENPFIADYQQQISAVEARGFQSGLGSVLLNERNGIKIAIGADTLQHIMYEFAIPLKELFTGNWMQSVQPITLNVTVNALQRPSSEGGDGGGRAGTEMSGMGGRSGGGMSGMGGGRSGGGRSGMGGGRSGGGMSHSGGNSPGGNRTALFEKASFRQKFTLTVN